MPQIVSRQRLDAARSAVLVIDLQEKLVPAVPSGEAIIVETVRLITAAKSLGIPFAATVQYPKGLGPLVSELQELLPTPEEKLSFSAAVCRGALDHWAEEGRDQIVIVGIETHVCVIQTVLDLIAEGQQPWVVAEAVGSRHGRDHDLGIQRMRDCGTTITTAESVLFEWLGSAEHPEFKTISKLVKDHRPPKRPGPPKRRPPK